MRNVCGGQLSHFRRADRKKSRWLNTNCIDAKHPVLSFSVSLCSWWMTRSYVALLFEQTIMCAVLVKILIRVWQSSKLTLRSPMITGLTVLSVTALLPSYCISILLPSALGDCHHVLLHMSHWEVCVEPTGGQEADARVYSVLIRYPFRASVIHARS